MQTRAVRLHRRCVARRVDDGDDEHSSGQFLHDVGQAIRRFVETRHHQNVVILAREIGHLPDFGFSVTV